MLQEFKDFISRGNVLMIAVGLILALYFAKIVDAFLNGVINPIVAAIFGESSFTQIGFDVGDARISLGLIIDAAFSFVIVAAVLFLIIQAYNNMVAKDEEEAGPTDTELLTQIRDLLQSRA